MSVEYGFNIERKGDSPSLISQVHGSRVVELTSSSQPPPEADAVFTHEIGTELHVFSADCLPVLFIGEKIIAAAHSGWRGAMRGVVKNTLAKVSAVEPETRVVLGPCLGPCCFRVKEDFVTEFTAARGDISAFLSRRGSETFFDLVAFVVACELAEIPPERINLNQVTCTYCGVPALPSYRRNGSTDPRIKAWIIRR